MNAEPSIEELRGMRAEAAETASRLPYDDWAGIEAALEVLRLDRLIPPEPDSP